MRRFYLSVAVLWMLYAADVFLVPQSERTSGTRGYIRKLGHVQRQAALHITGAMCSSLMDSLDAHADLLPFHLLVKKVVHRAAMRMATLPARHPLTKHVIRVASSYVKRHWAPMHEVLHTFSLRPGNYKDISPVWMGPKWEPKIQVSMPVSKE